MPSFADAEKACGARIGNVCSGVIKMAELYSRAPH
eukprot:CAMPEP_0183363682 /NCGR_PEP_ID=MMETSP0164_2-20130417/76378_1 /TAXON_ID=221442 /ORGANISM="Coccolithus pelagicus ssp braarudi, Strain PLY182g" /LENGTH=34 /DNA_ID= /DNA_START= /DNA_END= /DNA_ORIENTATION=